MVQLVFASAYKEPKLTPVKVLREELEKRGLSKKGKQQELRARLADAGGLEEDTNASAETVDLTGMTNLIVIYAY